jgi:hypothetical protein
MDTHYDASIPTSRDLQLLRLHVEAVWGVRLPPLALGDADLPSRGVTPPWTLYLAKVASGHVRIWRSDVKNVERVALLTRAEQALALPATSPTPAGISREVALRQAERPKMSAAMARGIARPIAPHECVLVDAFEPGASAYYLATADRAPIFGVVVDGRLLSIAHSSRRTAAACELGINTSPEARRRGFALAATVMWTEAVAAEGLVPLYSALAENAASLALAAAAGFRRFARAAYVTV